MRLPRKQKKIIRAILLCHTGNANLKKYKMSKKRWVDEKIFYEVWYKRFDMEDRRSANTVKWKPKN